MPTFKTKGSVQNNHLFCVCVVNSQLLFFSRKTDIYDYRVVFMIPDILIINEDMF